VLQNVYPTKHKARAHVCCGNVVFGKKSITAWEKEGKRERVLTYTQHYGDAVTKIVGVLVESAVSPYNKWLCPIFLFIHECLFFTHHILTHCRLYSRDNGDQGARPSIGMKMEKSCDHTVVSVPSTFSLGRYSIHHPSSFQSFLLGRLFSVGFLQILGQICYLVSIGHAQQLNV